MVILVGIKYNINPRDDDSVYDKLFDSMLGKFREGRADVMRYALRYTGLREKRKQSGSFSSI